MASFFLVRRALVATSLAAAALVCACGARGPLDVTIVEEVPDAGADVAAKLDANADRVDALVEAAPDVLEAAAPEASMGFDGGPLLNCGSCLINSCGTQLFTCLTSPGCGTALQCVVTNCVTGGTPNIGCLGNCTGGSATTQQQLLAVFGCVIGNCGSQCTSVLGGFGGGGGGGGGG